MPIAIQYMDRPNSPSGAYYGGYCINDGTNTVFVSTRSASNLFPVYEWLGNGDRNKGRVVYDSALVMPSVTLNAKQYNALVCTLPTHTQRAFTKGD
jgi:hypothetical protein